MTTARRAAGRVALATLAVAVIARGMWPAHDLPWLPPAAIACVLFAAGLAGAWRFRNAPAGVPLRRDPGAWALLAALGVFFVLLSSHTHRLTSDGIDHFVYLRSLWIDHDLDLANDYAAVAPQGASVEPLTPLGRTGNVHPIGQALAWAPFYAVADVLSRVAGRPADGDSRPYRNAVALASLFYGWLGLLVLYRSLSARSGRGPALIAVAGLGFGSFLYWYLAFAPTMPHATAFAAAAAFVALWLSRHPEGVRRAALLGFVCGVCALMRWPNVLLALLPAVEALPRLLRRTEWPALTREAAAFLGALLLAFLPQLIVWKLLYGSFLTIPQGAGFVAGAPAWGGVLFSPRHGLFAWSPLLYLAIPGLVAFARHDAWRGLAMLVFFAALTRLNAGVADWWGGAAFGGRRFDATLPLFGLGLAAGATLAAGFVKRHPLAPAVLAVAAAAAWNIGLARQYQSGAWDYSEPVAFEQMGHAVVSQIDRSLGAPFSLPAALLEWARSGRHPADYESVYMERPHARWAIRMGLDDRMFLEDGWSEPNTVAGVTCRLLRSGSAGLVVPLHRPLAYRLGARVAAPQAPGTRVRALVNQRPVGSGSAEPEWRDIAWDIPADALRPGRNFVRFRSDAPIAIAGVWMEPIPTSAEPN